MAAPTTQSTKYTHIFEGPGEVRALCRAKDWSSTALGPPEVWPDALAIVVRSALDSPFPINLWCGPDLELIYNDGYIDVLGDKHPAALGMSGPLVWAEIWPEIAPMFDAINAGGPPIYASDAPFVIERAGRHREAYFTFALSPVRDEAGDVVAYLNIVSETTDRVLAERAREAALHAAARAEARLREVFAQAPAFLAVLRGRDHVFEYVNAAYYQLVGHRELVGRPVFDAMPEVRGQGFEQLLDTVVRTGEPFIGREVAVTIQRTPDSPPEERFVDLVYYPITENDGTRSGVVAHGSDVTEHVLARREAQRARTEAEQANQAKSQFLANMSHEIRTPINAVLGYTDLLDTGVGGPLTPQQQQYIDRIKSSSHHLLGLVNDVLDLSKIEAGEMLIRVDQIAVQGVLDEAMQIVAAEARMRGLELKQEWECEPDVKVTADTSRVRQILLNLLSNALKFTPHGSIVIRCRSVRLPLPEAALPDFSPWVVIDVEDTGTGITSEQLARIFQPFVQAESGHTRTVGGTGLGLTISRRLARLMGGDLMVSSSVGKGSRFSVWLPTPNQHPVGARQWHLPERLPEAAHELPGLGALGRLLLASAERVECEFIERLRNERSIANASLVDRLQLADHTAALLALLANNLNALDEGKLVASADDGDDLQNVLAGRHGTQRRKLGWSEADIKREYEILHEVLDVFFRREAGRSTTADLARPLGVVHQLVDAACMASLAGYRGS